MHARIQCMQLYHSGMIMCAQLKILTIHPSTTLFWNNRTVSSLLLPTDVVLYSLPLIVPVFSYVGMHSHYMNATLLWMLITII